MKKIFGVALLVSFGSFLSAQYMIIGKDSISLDQYKKEYKYGLENNGIEKTIASTEDFHLLQQFAADKKIDTTAAFREKMMDKEGELRSKFFFPKQVIDPVLNDYMKDLQTEKQVQQIMDFRPTIIMVTPSYSLVIAEEFERQGISAKENPLKIGIFGAEPWGEGMRKEIEKKLGLDAIDIYGLTEVMGPGVACECIETKDGPVIWEDHFLAEIIDPETGEVLPDGEEGELVFTSLTKEAFPVIRYRTKDLTRLLPPTARSFRRLGKLVGRSDDMLIIRGVNVFPSQIEEQILRDPLLNGTYRLVLSRNGHLDEVEVMCELQQAVSDSLNEDRIKSISKELQHRIKTIVGISTKVSIMPFDSIPRTQMGKARRVFDTRPKLV